MTVTKLIDSEETTGKLKNTQQSKFTQGLVKMWKKHSKDQDHIIKVNNKIIETRRSPTAVPQIPQTFDLEQAKADFEEKWKNPGPAPFSRIEDFQILRTIGTGAFGRVLLVTHRTSRIPYALKVQEKKRIIKNKQIDNTINEKKVLASIEFPFIVNLKLHFQDNSNIYLVMGFIGGGELFSHLRKAKKFSEPQALFYSSQIVLAFEYLHHLGLVYRDLKPENLLIDYDGYIKIADFGFCKKIETRTWTLCGTPEYLAPEIILNKGYNKSIDWWCLGILIYEMTAGFPPFYAEDKIKIFEKIVECKLSFPGHLSESVKDLLRKLIQVDLSKRFGNLRNGVQDIKSHSWFAPINWTSIYHKRIQPQFIPRVRDAVDAGYFDEYKEEQLKISQHDRYAKEFAYF